MTEQPPTATRIDLAAYLQRIDVSVPVAADMATLRAIVRAHTNAIPFENLDPFLGTPVDLEFAAIQRKLVHDGRGGYCFEQNRLLGEALREIGFAVTDLGARVLWGQPDDAVTARSHMLLRIDLAGEAWLVDVGFGGSTPTAPLRFVADAVQQTPHEPFRLQHRSDGDWGLQVSRDGEWKTLYRFDLQPQYAIDYRVRNWWTSTSPESRFVVGLTAARTAPGRRLTLRNREFTKRTLDSHAEQRILRNTATIREALEHEFRIRLPQHPDLDRKLDNLPQ